MKAWSAPSSRDDGCPCHSTDVTFALVPVSSATRSDKMRVPVHLESGRPTSDPKLFASVPGSLFSSIHVGFVVSNVTFRNLVKIEPRGGYRGNLAPRQGSICLPSASLGLSFVPHRFPVIFWQSNTQLRSCTPETRKLSWKRKRILRGARGRHRRLEVAAVRPGCVFAPSPRPSDRQMGTS